MHYARESVLKNNTSHACTGSSDLNDAYLMPASVRMYVSRMFDDAGAAAASSQRPPVLELTPTADP